MRVLPRENDMRQFFREGGFSGNPEMYAFNHYKSLLGNTEWVCAVGIECFLELPTDKMTDLESLFGRFPWTVLHEQ